MKKHSSRAKEMKRADQPWKGSITIGMDLGDRTSRYCVLDGTGEVVKEGSVATTIAGMKALYGPMKKCRIAMEVGAHSPWVSRLLKAMGHEVIVANPRQLKVITGAAGRTTRWTRRCWPGWRGWIRNCCVRSVTAAKKRSWI